MDTNPWVSEYICKKKDYILVNIFPIESKFLFLEDAF